MACAVTSCSSGCCVIDVCRPTGLYSRARAAILSGQECSRLTVEVLCQVASVAVLHDQIHTAAHLLEVRAQRRSITDQTVAETQDSVQPVASNVLNIYIIHAVMCCDSLRFFFLFSYSIKMLAAAD